MLFDGRATILADGPLTVVAAFRASAAERASAYSPHDAHRVVETLCRDAGGGDRHVLMNVCEVFSDHARLDSWNLSTAIIAERVREAVSGGRLLFVPGWPQMAGYASGLLPADSRADGRLAQQIMNGEGYFAFEGERYAVVPVQSWGKRHRAGRHEVVPRERASGILKRLAADPRFSGRKSALDKAASQLAQAQARVVPDGLLMVRLVVPRPVSASASAPAPSSSDTEPPRAKTRKVLSIAWSQSEAWCSDHVAYRGTTEGYDAGDALEVAIQAPGGKTHDISLNVSSSTFLGRWQVKDVLPPQAADHFVRETRLGAEAGGQKALLFIKFAPTAKSISHRHEGHTFQVSVADYVVEVGSRIKFMPGWGASVVKLGSKVPPGTGGLLDGQFPWEGYRWMKGVGVKSKYWNGKSWKHLPKDFTLIDANNFCVGFYQSGTTFVCQYGGTWPETFKPWDVEAADKVEKIERWADNIRTTWTDKFDLKRADCKSGIKSCCRYRVKVAASFARQSAFAEDVIIVADGDIRSNDALFFLGEPRVAVAAHEFGHHLGNPDEYRGAEVDVALNGDGAKKGIDRNSIMGQNLTTVKARHFRLIAKVLAEAIRAEYGRTFVFQAVQP